MKDRRKIKERQLKIKERQLKVKQRQRKVEQRQRNLEEQRHRPGQELPGLDVLLDHAGVCGQVPRGALSGGRHGRRERGARTGLM